MEPRINVKFVEVFTDEFGSRTFKDISTNLLYAVPRPGDILDLPDTDEKGYGRVREVSWAIPKEQRPFVQWCIVTFDRS